MEEFIGIIIFALIWMVSMIAKIQSKKKSTDAAEPSKSGGLRDKLNDFIAKIQQQMEAQTAEGPADASEWRRLMEGGAASQKENDFPRDIELEIDGPPAPPPGKKPARPLRERAGRSKKTKLPATPEPIVQARKRERSQFPTDHQSLRRAVIWSEILSPPVALRDRDQGRW